MNHEYSLCCEHTSFADNNPDTDIFRPRRGREHGNGQDSIRISGRKKNCRPDRLLRKNNMAFGDNTNNAAFK